MTDPLTFTSASPRFALPFLFSGQAQKEYFVNEAHALTDLLLHPAVEGEADQPPSTPAEGECWLVGASPSNEWEGHEAQLAGWIGGAWIFAQAREGVRVLDRETGQLIFFSNGWQRVAAPAIPTGGATADTEARTVIEALVEALREAGIFPAM